jgi:hypothetical protein
VNLYQTICVTCSHARIADLTQHFLRTACGDDYVACAVGRFDIVHEFLIFWSALEKDRRRCGLRARQEDLEVQEIFVVWKGLRFLSNVLEL